MEKNAPSKNLTIGILAHVDAGKTTLAEAMLYLAGQLSALGRVDHQNTFLDTFSLERRRGITIFSKQARFTWRDTDFVLLDTPGHVDFSGEMERTLKVLDYAVLVLSGADGVQGHTKTLWKLLEYYQVPTFIFINKMDQPGTDREALLHQVKHRLHVNCVSFAECDKDLLNEEIATCSEKILEEYLENNNISPETISEAIADRILFPCYFGSALRAEGVDALMDGMVSYCAEQEYGEQFAAKVYQITRDVSGNRLTHMKITGGVLKVKMPVDNHASAENEEAYFQEKADQLRLYNGESYALAGEVAAGGICAVTGLTKTFVGQGLGEESENQTVVLEPVLTYQVLPKNGEDPVRMLEKLRLLEEEEPLLHIVWQEEKKEIHARVMGEVQIEVLRELLIERFGLEAEFSEGSIVYKETLAKPSLGIGHFEPLRHYAEVELLLEPGEPGSGMQFASLCSEDVLDKNWQRLILTHLEERVHPGVLTGSPVTDLRILLVGGRAHAKHTEGGDFRQATYRAVRQGLRMGESVLLEPVFSFVLELPTEFLGRAMSDVQRMKGRFDPPETEGEISVLKGRAPVSTMRDYPGEVNAYTHGNGRLSCILDGYEPCHNTEEVLEQAAYEPEADVANPTASVFCAHGAGYLVDWDKVPEYAHVQLSAEILALAGESASGSPQKERADGNRSGQTKGPGGERSISQEEINEIFRQSYARPKGDEKRRRRYHISHREKEVRARRANTGDPKYQKNATVHRKDPCLLVDGYNILFAWDELKALAETNIDSARDRLIDILSNYQGVWGGTLIVVFDAYKVRGNTGSVQKAGNIYVVYTKEAETADQYIEKTVHEMADKFEITVATSDRLEQMIIWGAGALRLSAGGLLETVENARKTMREEYLESDSRIAFRPFL